MKIISGPNVNFYVSFVFFVVLSIASRSWVPVILFVVVIGISVPLSIWGHRWTEKQRLKMLKDFPLDPYIQQKYRKP